MIFRVSAISECNETIKQRLPARCMWRNRNISISAERLPSAARTRESWVAHPSGRQIAGRTDRHTERLQKPAIIPRTWTQPNVPYRYRNRKYILCPRPSRQRSLPQMNSLIIGTSTGNCVGKITRRLHPAPGRRNDRRRCRLIEQGIQTDDLIYYGLEYKLSDTLCVIGKLTYEDVHATKTAIHQFAKRQMTWFRGMEQRGLPIHWMKRQAEGRKDSFVKKKLEDDEMIKWPGDLNRK